MLWDSGSWYRLSTVCIVVSGSLLLINSSYPTHRFWHVWLNPCIKQPKRSNSISNILWFFNEEPRGWCFIYLFHDICKCLFYLSHHGWQGRQGCAYKHFNKAVKNGTKTEAKINKNPSSFFFLTRVPHSVWIQAPSLQRFLWWRGPWGTGKELIRKTHTVNVQHMPKCFADNGVWAKLLGEDFFKESHEHQWKKHLPNLTFYASVVTCKIENRPLRWGFQWDCYMCRDILGCRYSFLFELSSFHEEHQRALRWQQCSIIFGLYFNSYLEI